MQARGRRDHPDAVRAYLQFGTDASATLFVEEVEKLVALDGAWRAHMFERDCTPPRTRTSRPRPLRQVFEREEILSDSMVMASNDLPGRRTALLDDLILTRFVRASTTRRRASPCCAATAASEMRRWEALARDAPALRARDRQ